MYLLDSNACIGILTGRSRDLIHRLRQVSQTKIALCSIVKAELVFGARKSRDVAANARTLRRFFAPFPSYPFDDRCAEVYGSLRAELERSGSPIGGNDLLIAATAVANDLVLVTHNQREFSQVVGLELEDWEA